MFLSGFERSCCVSRSLWSEDGLLVPQHHFSAKSGDDHRVCFLVEVFLSRRIAGSLLRPGFWRVAYIEVVNHSGRTVRDASLYGRRSNTVVERVLEECEIP